MSQRESGYERKDGDLYETPEWVSQVIVPYLPATARVWEPACGGGKMVSALRAAGVRVAKQTDISTGDDFLLWPQAAPEVNAIVTNPPYCYAAEFCDQALRLMEGRNGFVAMLLRTDFDHAKSRSHLFRDCPAFAKKIVLTKRIVWFDPPPGEKGKSPSFNHAWFVWDWTHEGPPTIAYGP